ncbi:MAG: long-chain-fatty-acid--CoA ligase [Promethearchaeota archaeon]
MPEDKLWYKFWPEGVPKHIDIPKVTLDSFLRNAAKNWPDRPATTYYGVQMNYKTLDDIADRIATKLAELGIEKGDTVALHFTNVPPVVAAYYGILRAGARCTLLSPLFRKLEIKYQLVDSHAKGFIYWEGFDALDSPVIPETPVEFTIQSTLGPWFTPDPTANPDDLISKDGSTLYLEDIIKTTEPNPPAVEVDPEEELACLQYTGGTTGLPKGAMLTHYNLVANCEQCYAVFPEAELGKEVMLTALPLYHIYAQTVSMNFAVRIGANQVLITNPREVEELIHAIEEHKVTIFPGVAALYNFINQYPGVKEKNLSSIKYCLSGAGPLPIEIQTKFEELTGAKLREGYGLTEASPVTHANPLAGRFKNGTIGLPVPNTDIKIVAIDDRKRELGVNEVGELCVKGPQVMRGYYNRDEENASTIVDGWLHTGDVALIDDEGYTVIKERLKNMVKYKGHSVYPTEVEALMFDHEAILDVAVIGVPDPDVGEMIKAYVVLKPEFAGKVSEEDVVAWARENMAPFKAPKEVAFLDEIPKTNTGKTLHRLLREGKTEV